MTLLPRLRRQFDYEFWANREELRALSALPNPPPAAIRLLSHIVAAQWLWLDRLRQNRQPIAVWPEVSLADCDTHLRELETSWRSYLEGLSDSDLSLRCNYTNSKGEAWENSVLDILSHLLLHSAYHRGQIALEVRRSGNAPAYTDYIHAVRQGLLLQGSYD